MDPLLLGRYWSHVYEHEMPTNEMTYLAGSIYGAGSETVCFSLYDDGPRHH